MEFKISKWPVIILANYRTGSSALTYKIAQDNKTTAFVEPGISEERENKFISYFSKSIYYVIKFMPDQIENNKYYQLLLSNPSCYLIKLKRKNKIQQIASYYIAKKTQKWYALTTDNEDRLLVSIDLNELNSAIEYILKIDKMLDEYKNYDLELNYEDFGYLDNLPLNLKLSSRPANYQRLLDVIKKKI